MAKHMNGSANAPVKQSNRNEVNDWAEQITTSWQKHRLAGIIQTGKLLLAAKKALDYGAFRRCKVDADNFAGINPTGSNPGARPPSPSIADLQKQLDDRTRERDESLVQQTAASELLGVISSSPGELDPVFEVMLRNATRICEAKFGTLYLCEGAGLHIVATHDVPSAFGGRVFPRSAAVCSSACHPAPLFVARRTEAHRSPARPPLMLDIDNQETRVPKIMDNEKRAFSIAAFCERYDIGRTSAYEEIAAGRLQVVKAGKRTLAPADAESWLRSLPAVEPKTLVAPHALAESTNEEAHERTSRRTAVPADAAEASLKNLPELPRKHRLHRGE